jgi:hypothetical protein
MQRYYEKPQMTTTRKAAGKCNHAGAAAAANVTANATI